MADSPLQLDEASLGQKVSMLFRIRGDSEHPFSEAVGLLQRVDRTADAGLTYHVVRRSGEMIAVPASDVIKLKMVPAAKGPVRAPASWTEEPAGTRPD